MLDYNIEELVRKYVNFSYGVASQGWNTVYCEYCGDGSRKKGPRGGWLFADAGESCFYHCFNNGCEGSFSLNREYPFSKNMRAILDSFGIPQSEYTALLYAKKAGAKPVKKKEPSEVFKFIDMPDHFALLSEDISEEAKMVKKFLKKEYSLTTKNYSFYLATGKTKSEEPKQRAEAKSLAGRLVIPYFKNGKMIYYQARDITGKSKLKYISPNIPKSNIIFNIDELYRVTDAPLYVTEGAQDAIHLNGVATMGNELSTQQEALLQKSKRRKILVPDFKGDSNELIDRFVENEWSVAFPTYRYKHKDVSAAIVDYGRLFVVYDIVSNIKTSDEARIMALFMNKS